MEVIFPDTCPTQVFEMDSWPVTWPIGAILLAEVSKFHQHRDILSLCKIHYTLCMENKSFKTLIVYTQSLISEDVKQ